MAENRPIFIGGCPRSGTTLLRLMLSAHPRIAVPPETRFLLPAYYSRARFGDLERSENRHALAEFIVAGKDTRFPNLDLDARAVAERIAHAPPTLGSALETVFACYAERFGKPRWGDKLPTYVQETGSLARMFPRAQFIVVIRDGRDCVASLKNQKWAMKGTPAYVALWNLADDCARWDRRRMSSHRWIEISYERLVEEPEPQLRKLCAFLGEQFAPAMLEPHRQGRVVMPQGRRWTGPLTDKVTTASIGRWRGVLEPWEVSLMHLASARRLRARGYAVEGERVRPPSTALAQYARAETRYRWSLHRRRAADRWSARSETGSVETLLG